MTNLDKIKAMSAEEFYKFDRKMPCHKCIYHSDFDGCTNTEPISLSHDTVCERGCIEWLNQEDNPMPEIQVGDIVEVEPHGITPAKRFVMLDSETAVNVNDFNRPQPAERMQIKDIKLIRLIWRYCSDGYYVVVWRDDNDTSAD